MRSRFLWVLLCAVIVLSGDAIAMKVSLYDLVTAEKLDYTAFAKWDGKWILINERDEDGRTPLHHLMRHQDTTVELVDLFIHRGARLEIKDDWGDTAYHESFTHRGRSPVEVETGLYLCDKKVSMHLFTEILVKKLRELQIRRDYEPKLLIKGKK